jgi:hypothetical protein
MHDLHLYNTETLHELYALAFWKVYRRFPENGPKTTRSYLIRKINKLSYKLASQGD